MGDHGVYHCSKDNEDYHKECAKLEVFEVYYLDLDEINPRI